MRHGIGQPIPLSFHHTVVYKFFSGEDNEEVSFNFD